MPITIRSPQSLRSFVCFNLGGNFVEAWRDVARLALNADRLKQATQVASGALVEIEVLSRRFAGQREFGFEPLKLDRQRGRATDDAALGRRRVVDAAEIGYVLGNYVAAAPDPGGAAVDARNQRFSVRNPRARLALAAFGRQVGA